MYGATTRNGSSDSDRNMAIRSVVIGVVQNQRSVTVSTHVAYYRRASVCFYYWRCEVGRVAAK